MPLTRYQIRNEYGLADPELYRAADKDDPEALLEGVAMAGLVGVLRQLGDLAEFAAEIFHDLHEEVLATASRGHSLMVRVQQLELEFPLIEKALLSQTNHSSFLSNQGADWHPNMRSKQNLIAQGDLPRFIMDSYEECRGPPRLFLLDKFDVAGAGACLKRYTDPSFFRVEASVDEVQRERKVRRVKKKGMRGRNGETPEILPASHAKLQQLFMEESIVNSYSNPSRLVKLKKRQFNEPPFCSRNGKSYMEKFVETPSPESKTVCEVSIAPPSLRWTTDCESGNEVVDVNMVSPKKNRSKEKGSTLTSIAEALLPETSLERLDGMVVNGKEMEEPELPHDSETYGGPTLYEAEKKEVVDAEFKMGRGMDVCHSDEITSEVENYVDALATMESEAETDNEYRAKNDKGFLNDEKTETDSDTNEEHLELQAQYSDSQSLGYSASEDGNTSLIKGSSSFTYSDGQSNLVDNIESDGEGIARAFLSAETSSSHHLNMTYNELPAHGGTGEIEDSNESVVPKHMGIEDDEISDIREASTDLCSIDMKAKLSPSGHGQSLQVESEAEGSDQKESEVDSVRAVFPDSASQKQDDAFSPIASESNPIFQSVDADPKVSSDVLAHSLTVLELAREHDSNITYKHEEFVFNHTGTVTSGKIIPWHSKMTLPEDQFQFLVVPEASGYSDLQSLPDSSVTSPACNPDMANLHGTNSEVHPLAAGLMNLDNPIVIEDKQQTHIIKQQSFDFTYDAPLHEQNAPEVDLQPLQENIEFGKNEPPLDFDDVVKVSWTVEAVEGDASPLNFPCNNSILSENANMHDAGTEQAPIEQLLLPTPVIATTDDNGSTSVDPAADIAGASADSQEPPAGMDHLPQKECESYEEGFPECNKELNLLEEARDAKVAYAENNSIPSDLISHPESEVETEMLGLSFMEKSLSRHSSDDATIGSGYEELGSEEPGPKPSSQGHLPWSSEDILLSLHVYHQVDQGETPEHLSDVPPHELDLNLSCEDEVSPWTVNPESEKLQSADLVVQENILSSRPGSPLECPLEFQNDRSDAECPQGDETRSRSSTLLSGQLQSKDSTGKEKYSAFESCPEDQPTQHSISESLQKSASQEVDGFSPVGPSLHTNIAISPQSSVLAEINQEDVPNLAPLPPSEWTIGKDHHVFLASQSEVIQDGQDSFQLLQRLPAEENPQLQLSASEGGLIWPLHTFLNVENEKLHTEEREDKSALPGPLSSVTQVPDGNSVIQDDSSVMEATEVPDHFLTSVSEHAFLDWGRGVVQSNSNILPPHPVVEDRPSRNDPVSSQGEVTQYIESTSSVSKDKVQQYFHEKSEAQHESSQNASGPSDMKQDEHLQHDLLNLDGERAFEATSALPENEVVQPNEKLTSNIPRPPKRLIEAVAAHDRSMLRKVTERIKPPIEPRANERDSLLEQIRTKSFNLKPAVVTRPSIQGPKTNLKVNAILEKANAIRQAFAGSDEDDDEDNWSDS
ncbi:protein SCAR2 [Rhodamnia argentea]|uniref:Protein SCAR n=1 Tax=Rhodamnia argentea TaxID=178133 RepID=A0A8B8PV49_9MYRT|nr:protein SCAR2 [Rhodamnia argentea]